MAVLQVEEQAHLRTGNDNINVLQWSAVRVFMVRTNNSYDDDGVALYAVDPNTGLAVPRLLSAHPTRSFLYVSSRGCRWVDEKIGKICEVSINYTVISGLAPWQEPAVISGGGGNETRIIDYDVVTGKGVLNSSGQPFDPGIQANRYEPTLSVQKNFQYFDTSLPQTYCDSVNSSSFLGAAEGYCMCTDIPFSTATYIDPFNNYYLYYSVTFQFAFKNPAGDGWQAHIFDAGLMQLSASNTLIPITIGGREPASPVPLKNGKPLPPGQSPVFIDFKIYPELDFSALQALWS